MDKNFVAKLRKKILESDDLPVEKVEVPEWGGAEIYIRAMNGKERDEFEFSLLDNKGEISKENFRARLLVQTLCADSKGEYRIFSMDDIEALGKKSAAALDRCLEKTKSLSGISDEDQEKMLKNSETPQEEGTG